MTSREIVICATLMKVLLVSGLPKSGSGVESKCKNVKKRTVVRVNLEVEGKKVRRWGGALVGLVKREKKHG